jgi:methylthioribose-1-phosphate isomerase
MPAEPIPPTIEWHRDRVRLVDQRALPARLRFLECRDVDALVAAIRSLAVRGAPALGAAGAFGVALAAGAPGATRRDVRNAARLLVGARPTAVNLGWGVRRALDAYLADGAAAALAEAQRIAADDVARNRALGAHGASLIGDSMRVMTQCNAGALACVGYGTALGIVRAAVERGRKVSVWVPETRPVLQGARLTAWELDRLDIPATLVTDNAVASIFARGDVDLVVVGADRIAANGDVANKIGTYGLAVLARAHDVPFVVAAPVSTIDLSTPTGADIEIEERAPDEVTTVGGRRIAPDGVRVHNPAFDVTPARLVSAVVTEVGVARRPFGRSLARHVRDGSRPREGVAPRP